MIVLIVKVSVRADKLEQFLGEVNLAIEATRKEAGVTRYELVQSVEEPTTFLMIEEYEDEAALAAHSETEHMRRLLAVLGTMVAGPPEGTRYNVTSAEVP